MGVESKVVFGNEGSTRIGSNSVLVGGEAVEELHRDSSELMGRDTSS